jgi:hypothetical protein
VANSNPKRYCSLAPLGLSGSHEFSDLPISSIVALTALSPSDSGLGVEDELVEDRNDAVD